jgi:nucleotide-binding universal stress UspA family protein
MTVTEWRVQNPATSAVSRHIVVGKVVFRHILVATDFSEVSRRALLDALALAANSDTQVSVIHVMRPDWRYASLENPPEIDLQRIDTEERLQAFVSDAALGAEMKIKAGYVRQGPVAQAVAAVIQEAAVDLLVIGTRGRGGLSKLALGSVAEELLRVAPCPVMTVGPGPNLEAITREPGFHRILFATDFGKGSAKALPLALALAKAHRAKLILLHMIPPMPATTGSLSAYAPASAAADELQEWESTSRKRALQELRACLPANHGLEQEPEYVVGTEFVSEAILTAVDKFKVDLIVMGANRTAMPRATAHAPLGAVHHVVQHATCPVLTVAG